MTLFISNTLASNGGTTFLIRIAKYYFEVNKPITVLVIYKNVNTALFNELTSYARIIFLSDLASIRLPFGGSNILIPFLTIFNTKKLKELLKEFESVHVMGIFGYLLAKRLLSIDERLTISVGVYHQNEFLYKSKDVFFNRWVKGEISNLNYENIVFFNEFCRKAYRTSFAESFSKSLVLPIGIPLRIVDLGEGADFKQFSITSVGNLVGFKTYNMHIIHFIGTYSNRYPLLEYNIYGNGEEEGSLRKLVKELGIEDRVHFLGQLDYKKFDEVVAKAHLFVGSGTAVLEAANIGVPSVVGIESCMDPVTYGYISDINGFDYNEYDPQKPKIKYEELITRLFDSGREGRCEIAKKCKAAVERFDISNTVKGFDLLESRAKRQSSSTLYMVTRIRLVVSFLNIAIADLLKIDQRFKFRRNQGTV